ncbi:MAG TPA: Uma2 family endonuclease [Chloroflexota bacterium]|nr:Uma2 family endonuclease [Chloroflexota bacterium]
MASAAIGAGTYRVPNWLPEDTEESVLGTLAHQEAINALGDMVRYVAGIRDLPWEVCNQVALRGLRYEDGRPYDPKPDLMVLPRRLPHWDIASVHVDDLGAPLFVAEVASESTVRNDIGEKKKVYAAIGVREYLVFDPSGRLLRPPMQGWRLVGASYVPWHADKAGWFHSQALSMALQHGQPYLAVRDRDGTAIELSHELRLRAREFEARAALLEQRAAESDQRAAESDQHARDLARRVRDLEQRAEAEARARAALEEEIRRLRG